MTPIKRAILTLVFLIQVYSVVLDITEPPKDTDAVIGHATYLNCSTSEPSKGISWYYIPFRQQSITYVYLEWTMQGDYASRARMEKDVNTGSFNLVILTVKASDAGKYVCQEIGGNQHHRSAELTVLDDVPVCEARTRDAGAVGPNSCYLEIEEIKMTCNATYHGNIPPIIEWTQDGESIGIPQQDYTSHVTSTLSISANLNMNSSSFVCQTMRAAAEQYRCLPNFTRFKIIYVLDNFLLTEKKRGEEAFCSVSSSQPCTYKWIWFDDTDEEIVAYTYGYTLEYAGTYRCEAVCTIQMRSCLVIAGLVQVPPTLNPDQHVLNNFLLTKKKKGEEAFCSVSSSQPCTYKWIWFDDIDEEIVAYTYGYTLEYTGTYRCEVVCKIQMRSYLIIAGLVQVPPTLNPNQRFGILVLVTSYVVFMVIMSILIYWYMRRQIGLRDRKKGLDETVVPSYGNGQELPRLEITDCAMINNELHVCRFHCPDVAVYDSENFKFKRYLWRIQGLYNAVALKPTWDGKFIFILDFKDLLITCEILRVDASGNLQNKWKTMNKWGAISVTHESHVILSVYCGYEVIEYSSEGEVVRTLDMRSANIFNPWHCIQLSDDRYVVSHGKRDDIGHRVCILKVDASAIDIKISENEIERIFGGGSSIGQIRDPVCLAVDSRGSIYVADYHNNRALNLDSELRYKEELLSEKHGLYKPRRLCIEEEKNRMLVIDKSKVWVCELNSDIVKSFELEYPH